MPRIIIQAGGEKKAYNVQKGTVTLGRGPENSIRLKEFKASRRHCQIVIDEQGVKIVDLASVNGTFVNGVQVTEKPIAPNDKIQIGATTIIVEDGRQSTGAVGKTAGKGTAAKTVPMPATRTGGSAAVGARGSPRRPMAKKGKSGRMRAGTVSKTQRYAQSAGRKKGRK